MKPLITLVVILGFVYYLRTTFTNVITSVTSSTATPACLELVGNTTAEENGTTRIIGSIRNNCDRKYGNVTISFKLDRPQSDDALPAGQSFAYVRDLQPGDTQQFQSALPVSKDATYRLDQISAF